MIPTIESIFLEHPYLAEVATPQQLEALTMAQVKRTPELLATAEANRGTQHALIEAHQVLTRLEERLLGGSPPHESVPEAQPEDVPVGFLPNLEREARDLKRSAGELLSRLASFRERLGVEDMDGFEGTREPPRRPEWEGDIGQPERQTRRPR